MTSPAFDLDATKQRQLWDADYRFQLPARQQLDLYARTDRPARVERSSTGYVLKSGAGELRLGSLGAPAEWLLERHAVSLQELFAGYPYIGREELRGLMLNMERLGLVYPYKPAI